ncbi:hypothetical protein J2Z65_004896 [Paenibacillus aceris]|uniref:DUF421 domain-containing protein n=2 Tax=Paenibacillus aceris TaxID=869555 RepID=A0ABS4I553_9BACL|nr:hypothetical protein [Paenibacillus aceris]MBP1965651.1 hypothetical protein [Paenibacillus aceris]
MKKYERSLKSQLLFSIISSLLCAIQLIINFLDHRPKIFIITFSSVLVIFAVLAILISLDLILKDALIVKGKIAKIDGRTISVLKANGKIRKVRIPTDTELELYKMDQELELIISRRTGILNEINTLGNPDNH